MSEVVVLLSTEKGAFALSSSDDRVTWKVEGPLLKGWKIFDLQADTRGDKTVLWAGGGHDVYGPNVHRSDDWGKTWRQIEHGPKYDADANMKLQAVWKIQPGRAEEPNVLYAGVAEAGLFKSEDGGEHWNELKGLSGHATREGWQEGAGGLCCHTIMLDPNNAKRMWVGISAVGIFRSEDGGATWDVKNVGLEKTLENPEHGAIGSCVHCVVLDPTDAQKLYQQNHRGLYRSGDGAETWESMQADVPSKFGFPIVMHPRDPKTLYVVPQESDEFRFAIDGKLTVYRTSDGGDSWTPLTKGLPPVAFVGVLRQAMDVDNEETPGVYMGTTGGEVYFSRDEGNTWNTMPGRFPRISGVSVVER